MIDKFTELFKWIAESNRPKHIVVGLLVAASLGIAAAISAGVAAEFKDWCWSGKNGGAFGFLQKGSGFDWLDLTATAIGGIIGSAIHYLIFKTL